MFVRGLNRTRLKGTQYGLGAAVAVIMILLLVAVTGYYIRLMVRTGQVRAEAKT